MNDFMRELCYSEITDVGKFYKEPEEVKRCHEKQDKISAELESLLDKEEQQLFKEYNDCEDIISSEAVSRGFSCGIKFILQVIAGAFNDDRY